MTINKKQNKKQQFIDSKENMFPMFMNLQILAFVTLITKVAIGVRVKVKMFNTTFNNLHFYRGGQFYSLQKYIKIKGNARCGVSPRLNI